METRGCEAMILEPCFAENDRNMSRRWKDLWEKIRLRHAERAVCPPLTIIGTPPRRNDMATDPQEWRQEYLATIPTEIGRYTGETEPDLLVPLRQATSVGVGDTPTSAGINRVRVSGGAADMTQIPRQDNSMLLENMRHIRDAYRRERQVSPREIIVTPSQWDAIMSLYNSPNVPDRMRGTIYRGRTGQCSSFMGMTVRVTEQLRGLHLDSTIIDETDWWNTEPKEVKDGKPRSYISKEELVRAKKNGWLMGL